MQFCNQRSLLQGRHDNQNKLSPRAKIEEWNILSSSFVFRLFSKKYTITMSVRTYNPSVLIGNWNEDVCLEEVGLFEQFHAVFSWGYFRFLNLFWFYSIHFTGQAKRFPWEKRKWRTTDSKSQQSSSKYSQKGWDMSLYLITIAWTLKNSF